MLDVLIGTGKTPVDTVNFSHITALYGYMDAYRTNLNCSAWPNFLYLAEASGTRDMDK
jgi:hypothetical protein